MPDATIDTSAVAPLNLPNFTNPEPAITEAEAFSLHSDPTAHMVIYLDFDGNTTSGTLWNSAITGGADIVTPAYDAVPRYFLNAAGEPDPAHPNPAYDPGTFTDQELLNIEDIWARVAEDFSPFDVDVTTQDPGVDRLENTGGADNQWGIRVCIGGYDTDWLSSYEDTAGGASFVNSFNWDSDTPCFVFSERQENPSASDGTNDKVIAETISHQVGQTLGLSEQGSASPPEYYFDGYGTGATAWGPIMGDPYSEPLTQWAKGEYTNADNQEDELAIITGSNGFGYRPDDHGNTPSAATPMTFDTATTVSGSGIIERNTDVDYFSFHSGAGTVDIQVNPALDGPNLDIEADLYDSTGDLVASDNPVGALNAHIQATVPAGDYYLKIDGVGKGTQGTGYSDYGSLGQYSFTGTVPQDIPSTSLQVTNAAAIQASNGRLTGFQLSFNIAPDPTRLLPTTVQVTGPTGAILPVTKVAPVAGSTTEFDVYLKTPQLFPAAPSVGGFRIAVSPFVTDTSGRRMDQNGNLVFGETSDFFGAASFVFNALGGGAIADNAVTDFPLTIPAGRPLTISDVNVRINLTHPRLGDLRIDLISPTNKIIQLVSAGTLTRANLSNTYFDDQATKSLDQAVGPYVGVFKPVGTLGLLDGDSASGLWKLEITDTQPGATGKVNSWGLTITTSDARTGLVLNSVTPVNGAASNLATVVEGLTLNFNSAVNPATLTTKDITVTNEATGKAYRILSVTPVTNTQFTVVTAPWTLAGRYVVEIGPNIADLYGNALEANGNGFYAEASDITWQTITVPDNVYMSAARVNVAPGRSVTTSLNVPTAFNISQLAVQLSLSDSNVGDLKITLIAPNGQQFVLVNQGTTSGADYDRTLFSDLAAGPLTGGSSPYRGDFQPVDALAPLIGTTSKGIWKLKIENIGASDVARLTSWSLFIH